MKRPALQSKRVVVLRMAFRARNVFGSFEKRTPDHSTGNLMPYSFAISVWVLLRPLQTIWTLKMQETGPTVYSPYPRRLEV